MSLMCLFFFTFQLQRRKPKLPIPTKVVWSLLPSPSTPQCLECLCLCSSSAAFQSFMVTDKCGCFFTGIITKPTAEKEKAKQGDSLSALTNLRDVANDRDTKLWIHKHSRTKVKLNKSTAKRGKSLKKKLSCISSATFPISTDQGSTGWLFRISICSVAEPAVKKEKRRTPAAAKKGNQGLILSQQM